MNERGRNEADISRYTDVEYSPEGYKTVYRWGDFLEIAGGHVYNAMDTIDLVSAGGEYEGFNPRYAYTCEFVGCSTLIDGIALFRPVSRDGEDLTQIAFLRSDIDDDTGAYTERFEAGSFDIAAASDIQCSDLGIDLLDYFRGRSFEGLSGVKRGLNGREAVGAVERSPLSPRGRSSAGTGPPAGWSSPTRCFPSYRAPAARMPSRIARSTAS